MGHGGVKIWRRREKDNRRSTLEDKGLGHCLCLAPLPTVPAFPPNCKKKIVGRCLRFFCCRLLVHPPSTISLNRHPLPATQREERLERGKQKVPPVAEGDGGSQ
jgi:hypothetical protein